MLVESTDVNDYCWGLIDELADPATIARNKVWADNLPRHFEQIVIAFKARHPEFLSLSPEAILNKVAPVILVGALHLIDKDGWYRGSFLDQLIYKGYGLERMV